MLGSLLIVGLFFGTIKLAGTSGAKNNYQQIECDTKQNYR